MDDQLSEIEIAPKAHIDVSPSQFPGTVVKTSRERPLAFQFRERIAPWPIWDYPGKARLLASVTPGYQLATIRHWVYDGDPVPPAVLRHYADILASRIAGDVDLEQRLRTEADRLDKIKAARPRNFTRKRQKPVP